MKFLKMFYFTFFKIEVFFNTQIGICLSNADRATLMHMAPYGSRSVTLFYPSVVRYLRLSLHLFAMSMSVSLSVVDPE